MNFIPWQRELHLAKQSLGKIPDPDAVLARLPPGTTDTYQVLAALLTKFNQFHAWKDKIVAHDTRHVRSTFYFNFFRQLRAKTKYRLTDPRQLAVRHVSAMVQVWIREGLSAGTIRNYVSYLRTFAAWIGKPDMIRAAVAFVEERMPIPSREQVARSDLSWEAHGVNAAEMISKVTALDPFVGAQLALELHFGVRGKEARFFRPHEAVIDREQARVADAQEFPEATQFVRLRHGTKGGRPRDVAVRTDAQRQLLDQIKGMVRPGEFVGRQHHTPDQAKHRYYWMLRRARITKKDVNVTAHGLRHGYANDLYEDKAGAPSPVRGGTTRPELDDRARLAVARSLGHGRKRVAGYYIGAVQRREPPDTPASGTDVGSDADEGR